uniref:Uncharacterized protein n=1 Tax=uncultured Alphaproteobacteria bacterium TaxID=91750 RepID=A0A6G8F2J4_9PROT|nr:hypothetical protein PlAlph_1420 [uncultured Alphaproteobacteria bacterium]
MKKFILAILIAAQLSSCTIYQRTTEYTADNKEYNQTGGYGGLYPQYLSVPLTSKQNLDFELSRVGIESDIAAFLMVIPFAFITDYKDMRQFDIRLLNPEQFDTRFLSQLQFSLQLEGKSYLGKQAVHDGQYHYMFTLDADIYGQPAVLILQYGKEQKEIQLTGGRFWHSRIR